MMVPRVEFTEHFSPVASDASLKTQAVINLKTNKDGWRTHSCDIEENFLDETLIEPHPEIVECGFMIGEQR